MYRRDRGVERLRRSSATSTRGAQAAAHRRRRRARTTLDVLAAPSRHPLPGRRRRRTRRHDLRDRTCLVGKVREPPTTRGPRPGHHSRCARISARGWRPVGGIQSRANRLRQPRGNRFNGLPEPTSPAGATSTCCGLTEAFHAARQRNALAGVSKTPTPNVVRTQRASSHSTRLRALQLGPRSASNRIAVERQRIGGYRARSRRIGLGSAVAERKQQSRAG